MIGQVYEHETSISMVAPYPAAVDAGTEMALNVSVSCSEGCDLRGKTVEIIADQGDVIGEIELAELGETANETGEFVVKAPTAPGSHTWAAVFRAHEKQDVLHKECSAPFTFTVKPHVSSIAVWDISSPIVVDTKFKVKVGVRCSIDCSLAGSMIEIYDQEGGKVGSGELGGDPWKGTNALYWTEVDLAAPSTEGYYTWQAKFPKPNLALAHEAASFTFGFITARQPEHQVKVDVIDKNTKNPIDGAYVLMSPYRNHTNEDGVATVGVARGEYELQVSKPDYRPFQTTVNVCGDMVIRAELIFSPVKDNGR